MICKFFGEVYYCVNDNKIIMIIVSLFFFITLSKGQFSLVLQLTLVLNGVSQPFPFKDFHFSPKSRGPTNSFLHGMLYFFLLETVLTKD
jgi:amino acid permease